MFTFKKQFTSIKPALILGTLCLSTLMGVVTVSSVYARGETFGLGGTSSSTSGGAVRDGNLPQVLLLVPPDGARTLSARPTLYWYVASTEDEQKKNFKIRIFLRENPNDGAKSLFEVTGSGKELGLYKFNLPDTAPSLVEGKVQRLHLRWSGALKELNLHAKILLDKNPEVIKAVGAAKTCLDKARILARELYWYDALDAYSQWIESHPKDATAIKERNDLLAAAFKSTIDDPEANKKEQEKLNEMRDELIAKLAKDTSIREVMLP